MSFETIRIATDDRGVVTLTLARPERHNALSPAMIDELAAAAERLGGDPAVRVCVLAGEGRSFCAGGDLGWMRTQLDADRDERMAEARRLACMLDALNRLPMPLVGRIHGDAYGGGVGLLSICDATVAADNVRLGLTETRLGLIPATISPYVVARMGEGRARRIFMSPRILGAEEGRELGLLSIIVPGESLDSALEAEIRPYLAAAPGAVAAAKSLLRSLAPTIDAAVIEGTVSRLADQWETPEAREGITAFFERRKPGWAVG